MTYKTRQKSEILNYLRNTDHSHVTAGDICMYFKDHSISISQATVYRQLEQLTEEGIVNKYIIDERSPACYEYIEKEKDCHQDGCYHFRCESCGKLIHLHCEEIDAIRQHLQKEHQLQLDPFRTVLYGLCQDCVEKADRQ